MMTDMSFFIKTSYLHKSRFIAIIIPHPALPVKYIVVHPRTVKDVEFFSPQQIKQVRMDAKMTQKTFAACIGVSPKSVEAWEGGRSRPDGAARRLIVS